MSRGDGTPKTLTQILSPSFKVNPLDYNDIMQELLDDGWLEAWNGKEGSIPWLVCCLEKCVERRWIHDILLALGDSHKKAKKKISLKVFLSIVKPCPIRGSLGPLVARFMKDLRQDFWSAEKDTDILSRVFISDSRKDQVPVWTAEMRACAQTGNGAFPVDAVVDVDIFDLVVFEFARQVRVDFQEMVQVFLLKGH